MPALHLITVCWFRPWGRVEKIKPMKNMAVSIYHAVTGGTNLRNATIKVRYTLYNEEKIPEGAEWTCVHDKEFKYDKNFKTNETIRQKISDVQLTEEQC